MGLAEADEMAGLVDGGMGGPLGPEAEKANKMKKSKQLKDPAKTRAVRAGLVFPVARIHQNLKKLVPSHCRVGGTAAVFMAAIIEYMVAELCELAGERSMMGLNVKSKSSSSSSSAAGGPGGKTKKGRITPRFLQFAIKEDHEFSQLLDRVTLSGGGVVPLSDKELKKQLSANKKKGAQDDILADTVGGDPAMMDAGMTANDA